MPATTDPWGAACGLLAASLVTLIGVAQGLDPDVILWRTIVSAVAVALTASILLRILTSIREDQ